MSFVFFDTIFPKGREDGKDLGFVAIALYRKGRYTEDEGPTQTHFFAWPSQREDLVAFCLGNSEKDVYAVPALFRDRSTRKGVGISHQWVAYADADTLPLERVRLEPTLAVETSPGRHHLYWVTEVDDPRRLVDISRTIAEEHAADGCDKSGWDAGQLLRVPGTTNNKRPHDGPWQIPQPTVGPTYTLEALAAAYPPYSGRERPTTVTPMPPKKEWYYAPEAIRESAEVFRVHPRLYDLYATDVEEGQNRSKRLWKMLCMMSRADVSRPTAMHIAWTARCNKYEQDGRTEEELWGQLCNAYAHPENQPVRNSFTGVASREKVDESEENPERKMTAFAEGVSILAPDERNRIPEDTFVDRYQRWAATCTDAPHIYHRAMAMTILCAVFGEFGKCPTSFETNLTLWFFILGPTTRARKTTAMTMGIDFLDELSGEDFPYIIGSDVTPEALNLILPEKNGRTSLYYRDEAHGLLREQSKKRYLVGSQEYETELFAGRVRSALRVGTLKEQGGRDPGESGLIRTNFIRLLCGTLEQVSDALTIESYQSGHMTRFLVAEADPPPLTEESMYIEQFDGQAPEQDVMRQALLNEIAAARAFWMGVTEPGETVRVGWHDDAWKRLQKAKYKLYRAAETHELSEVLLPTMVRMGDSTMKAATLLAMAERERMVGMPHLLKAMHLAEEWYRSTARVAGKILYSEWAAGQNEILTLVQSRKEGVTQQEVYSRFRAKMHEREIESSLNVLVKAGDIQRTESRGGRIRYIPVVRS